MARYVLDGQGRPKEFKEVSLRKFLIDEVGMDEDEMVEDEQLKRIWEMCLDYYVSDSPALNEEDISEAWGNALKEFSWESDERDRLMEIFGDELERIAMTPKPHFYDKKANTMEKAESNKVSLLRFLRENVKMTEGEISNRAARIDFFSSFPDVLFVTTRVWDRVQKYLHTKEGKDIGDREYNINYFLNSLENELKKNIGLITPSVIGTEKQMPQLFLDKLDDVLYRLNRIETLMSDKKIRIRY